jgi:hypothetical protein
MPPKQQTLEQARGSALRMSDEEFDAIPKAIYERMVGR